MSGEEPGYVPPDHKTTAEFRIRGLAAAGDAGAGGDATLVDGPADGPAGSTVQDVPAGEPAGAPGVTLDDLPADDVLDDDLPADDPEDEPEDDPEATSLDLAAEDPGVTSRDASEKASATVADIRLEEHAPPREEPDRPAPPPPPPPAPVVGMGEAPWTEQFGAEQETAAPGAGDPAAAAFAMPSPDLAGTGPRPAETAPAAPATEAPPARSKLLVVLVAAVGAVVLLAAAGLVALWLAGGGSEEPQAGDASPKAASPAASAPATGGPAPAPSPGEPSPGGTPPAAPPGGGQPPAGQPGGPPPVTTAPIGPLVRGDGITYQLVQQDEGYFEGRMVITNRTDRPMKTWKLTFRAPGADVKNIWGAALVHGGTEVEIRNLDGARAIPPGGTWEIQYGAAGRASTPKDCELNGGACGF